MTWKGYVYSKFEKQKENIEKDNQKTKRSKNNTTNWILLSELTKNQ